MIIEHQILQKHSFFKLYWMYYNPVMTSTHYLVENYQSLNNGEYYFYDEATLILEETRIFFGNILTYSLLMF